MNDRIPICVSRNRKEIEKKVHKKNVFKKIVIIGMAL
jgi:hypothetical protein